MNIFNHDSIAERSREITSPFYPEACADVVRMGLSDDIEYGLIPAVLRRLGFEAPNLVILVNPVVSNQVPGLLKTGQIALNLGYRQPPFHGSVSERLQTLDVAVLRADRIPGSIDLEAFCSRPHLMVTSFSSAQGQIDDALKEMGRSRHIARSVIHCSSIPMMLASTDLIVAVPSPVAQALVAQGGLRSDRLPFAVSEIELSMTWHRGDISTPAEEWLRSRLSILLKN